MRYVVLHHILKEQEHYQYAHHRIDKIEIVGSGRAEMRRKQPGDKMNQQFEQLGGKSTRHPHHERKNQHEVTLFYVGLAPADHLKPPFRKSVVMFCICHVLTYYIPLPPATVRKV